MIFIVLSACPVFNWETVHADGWFHSGRPVGGVSWEGFLEKVSLQFKKWKTVEVMDDNSGDDGSDELRWLDEKSEKKND